MRLPDDLRAAPVTLAIAILTAAAWLIAWMGGWQEAAAMGGGFIPARVGGFSAGAEAVPALLTPFTSTLVHSGFAHLFMNLIILLFCGRSVERVLGGQGIVILYLVGAYAAAAAQWLAGPASLIPVIGASGAISAVIGAFALSFSQAKRVTRSVRLNQLINAAWLLAAWVVMQMMIGWMAGGQGVLLATPAHVGGFLAGLLLQRPLLLWRYRTA
jgi:membrane associated rhomboid family serine protease